MRHHLTRNYLIISVMFWSFPYLFWQAFGHWSGFFIGMIISVILTEMLKDFYHVEKSNTDCSMRHQSLQTSEPQQQHQETEPSQRCRQPC